MSTRGVMLENTFDLNFHRVPAGWLSQLAVLLKARRYMEGLLAGTRWGMTFSPPKKSARKSRPYREHSGPRV
jgi:hypothetical protein